MADKQKIWFNKMNIILLTIIVICSGAVYGPVKTKAASTITLDSPQDGARISGETIRIMGTYTNAYNVKLTVNGEKQVNVVMEDQDGNDSGTWYYDLNTSDYDGNLMLNASGLDIETRYGVWSPSITLHIDHSKANVPKVTIVNPSDGTHVAGSVPIQVKAEAKNTIRTVQVRINNGPWHEAKRTGNHYQYKWSPSKHENKTYSIQGRAIDEQGNIGVSFTTYAKVGKGPKERITLKKQDRAMWIWEPESYKLLLNPKSRHVLNAFAKDTTTFQSDAITTFYLGVGRFAGIDILEDEPDKVKDFIKWAHENGFQVHACIAGGTSPQYLGAYQVYHDYAIREMEKVLNYNVAAEKKEAFDGVNVDIEPYISPDFKSEYPSLQIQYLDGLQKMIARRDAAGINLPFGPAIPKWFDTSDTAKDITWGGSTKWLSEHIQDISDYISIMDYRDTADGSAGIIAGAQGEIDYAKKIGKQNSVVIGVETLDIANSGDPSSITFREEGRTYMEQELDKVYSVFGDSQYFGGIALHHYDSIRTLPSSWGLDHYVWEPPVDMEEPTAVSQPPTAAAKSYQEIELSYGMAYDDTDIDRYIIYRSTTKDFTPDSTNIAGLARGQSFLDFGLLPNTTYYYKVAAMDLSGKIGPLSKETSAKTGNTTLKPMILKNMSITFQDSKATSYMELVDKETLTPIADAHIEGRFTYAGGKYVGGMVNNEGAISLSSESILADTQIGFEPRRVTAKGYYWAAAYDKPHSTTLYPKVGLSNLTVSAGQLNFSPTVTSYTVKVPNDVSSVHFTPTAAHSDSVITVNGKQVSSGSPSQELVLKEGKNTVSLIVANRDGSTDTYTIQIIRESTVVNKFFVTDDTYVYENSPQENFGTAEFLEVADFPSANGGGDRLAYMKFDFSSYSKPIDSAKLYFYVPESLSKTVALEISGYVNKQWNQFSMNWDNRIGGASESLGMLPVQSAGWYSVDVSEFMRKQSSEKMITFRFMDPKTKSIIVKINSSKNKENQPYLMINP
ncbi:DNRLRE domain-containing protein [Margalitia sp. FSL K6-0131]|uniref:CBM96 family carbohydrate-binding protein n=1 Tax=Margalitia sp. FSL K6-0131 TaxID=2954604 RepID=UPI0030F991A5